MKVSERRRPKPHWHWHFANFAVLVNLLMTATMLIVTLVEHIDKVKHQ